MVIQQSYLQLGKHSELTAFTKGKGWGFIDVANVPVIAAKYDYAESFKNGYAIVESQQLMGMIDTSGTVTIPISFKDINPISTDKMLVSINNLKGVYSLDGKVIVPVEYEQIRVIDKDFLILAKTGEIHYLYLPDNLILKLKAIDE